MTQIARAVPAAAGRLSPRWILVAGTLSLLGLRLLISLSRSGPVIMADEAGYLFNAKVLAGGMAAEMGSSPFYRGGYSLVIAPILALDAGPVATYHGVLVVNALLAASLAPLLYLLLTRCFDVAPSVAAWSALAGAAYPSVTALSQVALSENLLFPLTVAWLLAVGLLLRARERRGLIGWAVASGLTSAALWTVHGRMLVAVVLTVVVLALLAVRDRSGRAAAAGIAALGAGMLAGRLLNDWLVDNSYGGSAAGEVRDALSPLNELDGLLSVGRNLVGQGWYLLAATLGILVLLVAWVAPPALGRLRRGRGEPADHMLALLLATAAGLLAVSALWLADLVRADQLIYGRYAEPVVPAIIAAGLALLTRTGAGRGRVALVAVLGLATAAAAVLRAGVDLPGEVSRWNVASLPSVTGSLGAPVIAVAGAVAMAALWGFALVARRWPAALAPLALLAFMPLTAYVVNLPVIRSERDFYPSSWTSPRPVVEQRGAATVGYDLDRFDHIRVKTYQWAMPDTRVVLFHGKRRPPPAPLFFSGATLSGPLAARGATAIWRDPSGDQALWQVAGG